MYEAQMSPSSLNILPTIWIKGLYLRLYFAVAWLMWI